MKVMMEKYGNWLGFENGTRANPPMKNGITLSMGEVVETRKCKGS